MTMSSPAPKCVSCQELSRPYSGLGQSDHCVIVITNHSVVGRGIIALDQASEINQRLIIEIEAHVGTVDASYLCPHHPDEGCSCREPAPGMANQAAHDLELDLTHSYVIGDAVIDIEAAVAFWRL